jgi:hypothetical protein
MLLTASHATCRVVVLDRLVHLLGRYRFRVASSAAQLRCVAFFRSLNHYSFLFSRDHLLGALLIYSGYRNFFPDDPIRAVKGGPLAVLPLNRDELLTWSDRFPEMVKVVFEALASIGGPRDSNQVGENQYPQMNHSVGTTIDAHPGSESWGEIQERSTAASRIPDEPWHHSEDNPRYPYGDARTEGNLIELAHATESYSGQGPMRKASRRTLKVRARKGLFWIRTFSRERYRVSFKHKAQYERAVRLLQELRDHQVPSNRGGSRSKSSGSD